MSDIISINTDRRALAVATALRKAREIKAAALLLQDPPSQMQEWLKIATKMGYTAAKPEPQSPCTNDHIILIRNDVGTENQSALAIGRHFAMAKIKINGHEHALVSAYVRPRESYGDVEQSLRLLEDELRTHGLSRTIIMGDLNATDPDWAPPAEVSPELGPGDRAKLESSIKHYRQIKKARGTHIASKFRAMKLRCANNPTQDPPTFVSNQNTSSQSHIDVAYLGTKSSRIWQGLLIQESGIQHRMLILKAKVLQTGTDQGVHNSRKVVRLNRLEERHFEALKLEFPALTTNLQQLTGRKLRERADKMTSTILSHLLQAQEAITIHRPAKPAARPDRGTAIHKRLDKLTMKLSKANGELGKLVLARYRAQQTKPNGRPTRAISKRKVETAKTRRRIIRSAITETVINGLITDQGEEENIWKRVELDGLASATHQDDQGPSMNAAQLEAIATEKFGHTWREADRKMTKDPDQSNCLNILQCELENALHMVRDRKFTGPEGLRYTTLLKAAEMIKPILYRWAHTCLRAAYTPDILKLTKGIIIPKKQPGKYRIVHVGCPLTSILERIALSRLEYRLEQEGMLNPRQFGFTANVDRHDLVTRVIEMVLKNSLRHGENRATTIVSLDIRGAFDNVDQELLGEKLATKLANDPIGTWLYNFIFNRRITLHHGTIKSEPRAISSGVPQGSILGPVLWNLAINEIDTDISSPDGETEVLAYADDLLMIYSGDSNEQLQHELNRLVSRFDKLNLQVEPEKCDVINMRWVRQTNRPTISTNDTPTLFIYGKEIRKTNTLTILGVPITNQVRLDLDICAEKLQAQQRAQIINRLQRHKIIKTAKEWSILVDSYLTSTIILNHIPILLVDKKAREWCDKMMNRAVKRALDWPSNCSDKVVRTVANLKANAEVIAQRITRIRAIKLKSHGHRLLLEVLRMDEDLEAIRNKLQLNPAPEDCPGMDFTLYSPLSLDVHQRRYFRPDSMAIFVEEEDTCLDEICGHKGPIWIVLEGGRVSGGLEVIHDGNMRILQDISVRHVEFATGYFNLMALLWQLANAEGTNIGRIAIAESSGLLQALRNPANHDWRVILLRERLHDRGWSVSVLKERAAKEARWMAFDYARLKAQDANTDGQVQPHAIIQPTDQAPTGEDDHGRPRNDISWSIWPPTEHYDESNLARRQFEKACQMLAAQSQTSFLRLITGGRASVWERINPCWIGNTTALTLAGLVKAGNLMIDGSMDQGSLPKGCDDRCRTNNELFNDHTTTHRAFYCHKYKQGRKELRKAINRAILEDIIESSKGTKYPRVSIYSPWKHSATTIHITMDNPRQAQTLLKGLNRAAQARNRIT